MLEKPDLQDEKIIACLQDEGGEDREESLGYLKSNFMPNGTIQVAYQAELTWARRS